jgi:putative hydrolase of HD superfamily
MQYAQYVKFLNAIEKLKCNTRHSWNSNGRQESVAEHSWRLAVMAMLCRDEYPDADIDKVIKMCLIHDFGEAITGDIPAFFKTEADEAEEEDAVASLLGLLPRDTAQELGSLFAEMNAMETTEAKLYKALDTLEALVAHNEADISTWLPREYEDNLTYGQKNCEFSEWTRGLKAYIKAMAIEKMENEGGKQQ